MPVVAKGYSIEANSCRCHPETCCCADHVIMKPDGTRLFPVNALATAERIVALFNAVEGFTGHDVAAKNFCEAYGEGKFTFGRNRCNCHPETCCCADYAIFAPRGEKVLPIQDRELGTSIVQMINHLLHQ